LKPAEELGYIFVGQPVFVMDFGAIQHIGQFSQGCGTGDQQKVTSQPMAEKSIRRATALQDSADQDIGVNDNFKRHGLRPCSVITSPHIANGLSHISVDLFYRDVGGDARLNAIQQGFELGRPVLFEMAADEQFLGRVELVNERQHLFQVRAKFKSCARGILYHGNPHATLTVFDG